MKYFILLSTLVTIVVTGCTKAERNVKHYAGSYNLYKYELQYFNGDNTADSTFTIEDVADLGLYDEKSSIGNPIAYSSNSVPRSWVDNGFGLPNKWYSDNGRGKTITIGYNDPTAFGTYVTYDVERDGLKKYKWTTVVLNSNNSLNYIETLYLKKN